MTNWCHGARAVRLRLHRAGTVLFLRTLDGQQITEFLMEGRRTAKVAVVGEDGYAELAV